MPQSLRGWSLFYMSRCARTAPQKCPDRNLLPGVGAAGANPRSRDGAHCAQRGRMVLMRNRIRPVAKAVLGGLLGITLVFAAGAAAFAGDDEDEDTIEQKLIKNIMKGMGADVDKDRIDFRERSPLV